MNPLHEVELVDLTVLKPHPQNYRHHPAEQLEHIRASIEEHGFYRNVVAARDYTILAGHGAVEAAGLAGLGSVPVVVMDLAPTSTTALKILAADNLLGNAAEDDDTQLLAILKQLREEDDLLGTGLEDVDVAALLDDESHLDELDEGYSRKIEAPIYTPTGKLPEVSDLTDRETTDRLLAGLEELGDQVPADVLAFLQSAAERHTKFRYDRIAEWYAQQTDPAIQQLMEESALVIIDYDQALELGFISLSQSLQDLASTDAEGGKDA